MATTQYTYNSFGEVLNTTDPLGNVTMNTYDSHGNLLTVTTPPPGPGVAGSVTTFTYNSLGELLTIKANNQSASYGSSLPTLTASYSGFVNGDTSASLTRQPTLSTTAGPGSPVGTYTITVGGAQASNYQIVYVSGTLHITQALLTITAPGLASFAARPTTANRSSSERVPDRSMPRPPFPIWESARSKEQHSRRRLQ